MYGCGVSRYFLEVFEPCTRPLRLCSYSNLIEGLKQPLQEKVELQHPQSLAEAMALALRLGENQDHRQLQVASVQKRQWHPHDSRQPSGTVAAPTMSQPSRAHGTSRITPILVSNAEKSKRSRKGLCWHCPEKYVPGHVCAVKLLCYVGEEDDCETEDPSALQQLDDQVITADISHLHLLSGNSRSKPFQVQGVLALQRWTYSLIQGVPMISFIPVAERLRLSLTPIRPFRVYVGNEASLTCSHVPRRSKLTMQGAQFLVDLHILDIHGPDVILGMAWLKSLGKIHADFVGKTLEFQRGDKQIV